MLSEKFIKKYLRMAKQVGEDSNPCLSRSIGVVVVNLEQNRVVSVGYNGPPKGTPHPDDPSYLRDIVWPQLTDVEKESVRIQRKVCDADSFAEAYGNCGKCPRKIVGAASGQRLEICSCEHGERNAVTNSVEALHGAWMICWCGVPCWECSKVIINAGIKRVVCTNWGSGDYSMGSRWLLTRGGVGIDLRDPDTLDRVEYIPHLIRTVTGFI